MSLNWTKPEGQSSFYKVQWTDGNVTKNDSVNETYVNISELTAGEQYTFAVMTVAGDQKTVGEAKTVSLFTSKMSSDFYVQYNQNFRFHVKLVVLLFFPMLYAG